MEASLLSILPSEVQDIVRQVEDRCGSPIGVKPMPSNVHRAVNLAPAAMEIDTDGKTARANLMLASDAPLPAHMLAHEILHAKHTLLDCAPWIQPRNGQPSLVAMAINNDAAHMEIIPTEIALFPEAKAFWASHQLDWLNGFAERIERDADRRALRNDLLRFHLVTGHILPDWPHLRQLDQQISGLNLSSDAAHLRRGYEVSAGRREHVLSTLVRFHRLKPDDFQAFYAYSPPSRLPRHGD